MKSGNSDDAHDVRKLISSAVTMFLCLVVLICAAFAWFPKDGAVTATGMNLSTIYSYSLKISKTAGGNDIATFDLPDNLFSTVFDNTVSAVYPGCSGYFDMYLTVTSGDLTGGTITMTPEIIPGGHDADGVYQNPYNDGYDATSAAEAVNYMQGHILLFTNLTNGVYSGWLDPFNGTPVAFTNNQRIRIYWVWADYYYKYYTPDLLFSQDDTSILKSYFINNNTPTNPTNLAFTNLFDRRGVISPDMSLTKLGHYYDFADETIGVIINTFSFGISYSDFRQ